MEEPQDGRFPGPGGEELPGDAEVVVTVLHLVGRCSLRGLAGRPELAGWTPVRLEQAVARAWSGGLVFIDPNDDLVALRPWGSAALEGDPHLTQDPREDP